MLEEKLQELGLSDKEVAVYMAVVEAGKASPARVAKATGIKRPTVYAVGAELMKRGLLDEDAYGTTMLYVPASVYSLKRSVEREKQALKDKEELLKDIAKEIEEIPKSQTYAVPKIKFIEHEENVVEFLYKQLDMWNQSGLKSERRWWGFQDKTFVGHELYRKWIYFAWNHMPESIDLRLLSNDSEAEKQMQAANMSRRHIKFWKGALNFTATQWIVGDYSILLQTAQKPHYLVQLYDPVYTQNMRALFKSLWEEVK